MNKVPRLSGVLNDSWSDIFATVIIVAIAFLLLVAPAFPQAAPIEHADGRPLLKVAVVTNGCYLNHQIATDVVAHLFPEYRTGDAAGTQNLALQKQQVAEEQSEFYLKGRGRKQIGYFQSADYTLNVSVECGQLEYGYHPAVSGGQLIGEGVRAGIEAISGRRSYFSGYNVIQNRAYYTARVRVSMALEANGDIVTVKRGRGEGTGRSNNFGKLFTWSSYSVDDPTKAVFDGFYKAVEKAKKNLINR